MLADVRAIENDVATLFGSERRYQFNTRLM